MKLFEELQDVDVRDEVQQEKSDLEKVLEIEDKIMKQYKTDERAKDIENHDGLYDSLYADVQEKIKEISFSPKILQNYIDVRNNTTEYSEAHILGMYSAALLEHLCTTQPNTQIVIDGKDKTFNYLFYHVKNVKYLTLKNMKGRGILQNAGRNHGKIESIMLNNIIGDFTLYNAGSNHGIITYVTAENIKGDFTLAFIGSEKGNAKCILLNDSIGNEAFHSAGVINGNATHITVNNVVDRIFLSTYWSLIDISYLTVTNETKKGKQILIIDAFQEFRSSEQLLIEKKRITKQQQEISTKISIIGKSMSELSFEEQKNAHDKIAELQKEPFTEEK